MKLDIEKALSSVNHLFLVTALERYGDNEDFIKWIQIQIQNEESCVINRGRTTNYFKLERGTRQGNPILAYLFILVLEVAFITCYLLCKMKIPMVLIFLKIHFYTQRMQTILYFFLKMKICNKVNENLWHLLDILWT